MSAALVPSALRLLRRRAGAAYTAAALATAVNTVPDVLRQVLVWSSPSSAAALAVDVVGFLTALVAQVWLVGALAALPDGGIDDWVRHAYADVPPAMWPWAARSLTAHVDRLRRLAARG